MKQKEQLENSLKHIMDQEGLDEISIRRQIALAISLALKSNNANQQNFWAEIPCQGNSPTIDEITDYLIIELAKND